MNFLAELRQLSALELGLLGKDDVAYVKRVIVDGGERYAVHAADGTQIAVLASRELAFIVIRQNDMEPASVH